MSSTTAEDVVARLSVLTKSFGPTRALDGAEVELRRGTVHALLGGNGSGKSTAIKILAGVYEADAGAITIGGAEHDASRWTAADAKAAGLRFVHQDLGLFDDLSIAENFALDAGYPTGSLGKVRWRQLRARVVDLLERFEIEARPEQAVGTLRPAQRTMVAIARALQDSGSADLVLVLDEPTATLPAHESDVLLRAIRRRADLGQSVLMVSHRMQEVLSVAHDFTVFRDGRSVAHLVAAEPTEEQLVGHMTGRELGRTIDDDTSSRFMTAGDPALEVIALEGGPMRGVDLTVTRGEIVGVTGLVGSGRSSLLRTVFGVHRPTSGRIRIDGRDQTGREDTKTRMSRGVAYVAEDRVAESSFLDLSVRENMSMSVLRQFWRIRGMSATDERRTASELVTRHQVKTLDLDTPFATLSGGNQQKAVLARWLRREPRLLLLDEPTQGVDVMSRRDIYRTIREAVGRGCAVVVASSDFVELAALCDRVVVLQDGRVATELRGARLTPDHLTAATQSTVLTHGATP